jgi:signal transduction histidine kinase
MFSKSLNLRLTALFSIIFILCSLAVFTAAYLLFRSSQRQETNDEINARLLEFYALYQTGGLELVREEVAQQTMLAQQPMFMIRVASRGDLTLLYYIPEEWQGFSLRRLESLPIPPRGGLVTLRSRQTGASLVLRAVLLPDGNVLEIGINTTEREAALRRFRQVVLLVLFPLAGIGILGGYLFSSRSLRPIKGLIRTTRGIIDTGKLDSRLEPHGSADELGELVALFNRMLDRIDALVTGMRESLDNVAHDLRTPMARLRAAAEEALGSRPSEKRARGALTACLEESGRILNMLNTLMDISEVQAGAMRLQKRSTELTAVVADLVELYGYTASEKGVSLESRLPERLSAPVDLNRFRQVVANLLDNAVKYTPPGGRVTLEARAEGAEAVIEVTDSGAGIPPQEIERIWERLYRGERSRSQPGLGLGLSLVRAIVEAHGGRVAVESPPGEGSRFSVRFPVEAAAQSGEASPNLTNL